jgi:transcriptional regulator with XRE-family HTH domain
MTGGVVPARRRLVGACLRACRTEAGYTLAEAAAFLECDPSKVSRIETGQRGIRARELHELLDGYGAGPALAKALAAFASYDRESGWWSRYEGVLPGPWLEFASAESAASAIAAYAPLQVPELLQTPGYARLAARADPCMPGSVEEAAVTAVADRQRAALREGGPRLSVVLGEAVLVNEVGNAADRHDQLSRLVQVTEAGTVSVRLLPFSFGVPAPGGAGGFSVLRFGELPAPGLVHVAGPAGGLCPSDPDAAAPFLSTFAHMEAHALTREATALRLRQIAETT